MRAVWDHFWFKSIDARQYAALRIVFGGLTAIYFLGLLPYVETQFSASGWLGDIRQIAVQNGGSWSLFYISTGSQANTIAYVIVIVGLLAAFVLVIGWHSRLAACITWLVWVSLWNRNPLLLDGDDAVLKVMCFYLMLSPCGNVWSVDSYIHKRPQFVSVWPLRLMQFQVALIYFVSGWVKFHSQEWLQGTAINYVLVHPHYSRWDGWFAVNDLFIARISLMLAWFIRWWELMFPFLLISRYTRKPCIAIGILFHLGLLMTMNLRWFAMIMLALYLALVSNRFFLEFEQKVCTYLGAIRRNSS